MRPPETGSRALGRSTVSQFTPQSIQSARLSFQSSELGFPHPITRKEVLLLPQFGSKGGDTLAWGGRGWGNPIPTKGQTLWYSMYEYYNPSTVSTHHKASVSIICLFSFYKEKSVSFPSFPCNNTENLFREFFRRFYLYELNDSITFLS
jgi:hypothetical protein